jgi:hypothetical protein
MMSEVGKGSARDTCKHACKQATHLIELCLEELSRGGFLQLSVDSSHLKQGQSKRWHNTTRKPQWRMTDGHR